MTDTSRSTQPDTGQPDPPPHGTRTVWWFAAGLLVVILAVVAGLTFAVSRLRSDGTPAPPATSSSPPSSPATSSATSTSTSPALASPSPSTSATPSTARQQAGLAAQAAYRKYLAVADQIGQDGGVRPERLKAVSVSDALIAGLNSATQFRARRWHQVGDTVLVRSSVVRVSLTTDAKTFTVPEVVLSACTDVRGAAAVDRSGSTVRPSSSPVFGRWQITVRDYPNLGGWLVADEQGQGVSAC